MSWLRIDDKFGQHPKILALSDREFRIHVLTLCYCAEYNTDGIVPKSAWKSLGLTRKTIEKLSGLNIYQTGEDGALTVKDWRVYNPIDPTSSSRKQRFLERQRNANKNGDGTDEEHPGNGPHTQARAPVPVPSRPVLKETSVNPSLATPPDDRTDGRSARTEEEQARIDAVDQLCGYTEMEHAGQEAEQLMARLAAMRDREEQQQ